MKPEITVHRWVTVVEYYDIENGEQITPKKAKLNYNTLKKHKHVKIEGTTGKIIWINECERKKQLRLKL